MSLTSETIDHFSGVEADAHLHVRGMTLGLDLQGGSRIVLQAAVARLRHVAT